ncbi:MAG: hypothetical protein U0350_49390 [Caldilineaceae bacterium]
MQTSSMLEQSRSRFPLGQVLMTPDAIAALAEANQWWMTLLACHAAGDWGNLPEEDRRANERTLKQGGRLFSAYTLSTGQRLWVITEADRSATTLLLPAEY